MPNRTSTRRNIVLHATAENRPYDSGEEFLCSENLSSLNTFSDASSEECHNKVFSDGRWHGYDVKVELQELQTYWVLGSFGQDDYCCNKQTLMFDQ